MKSPSPPSPPAPPPRSLPARLAGVVATLLARSERSRRVSIDAIGEAFGVLSASSDDVDRVMTALEAKGRSVTAPQGGDGPELLAEVLKSARALGIELGRSPRVDEIAAHAALPPGKVWRALTFARVLSKE